MAEHVGIVLVSHSEAVASGLRDMLLQLGTTPVPVEAAGGTEDGRMGTSYERIAAAIDRADRGAGVVIICDLGSAVLTTRAVLADRDDDPRLTIANAPFVEGAVAAAVIASIGSDLAAVTAAAEEAREATKL